MTGHQAFDELVREGFMEVNELGWGRIVKPPRTHRDLDFLVSRVKTLGSWSVSTSTRPTIEMSTGGDPDSVLFRTLHSGRGELVGEVRGYGQPALAPLATGKVSGDRAAMSKPKKVSADGRRFRADACQAAAEWLERGEWTDDARKRKVGLGIAAWLRWVALDWRRSIAEPREHP
jgi:hypothetical protein